MALCVGCLVSTINFWWTKVKSSFDNRKWEHCRSWSIRTKTEVFFTLLFSNSFWKFHTLVQQSHTPPPCPILPVPPLPLKCIASPLLLLHMWAHTTGFLLPLCMCYVCLGMTSWDGILSEGLSMKRQLLLSADTNCPEHSEDLGDLVRVPPPMPACQLVVSLCRSCFGNHIVAINFLILMPGLILLQIQWQGASNSKEFTSWIDQELTTKSHCRVWVSSSAF